MKNNNLTKKEIGLPEVKSSFWNYIALILSKGGVILLAFVSISLIIRILGPENYGRFSLFLMVSQILVIILISWTSGAVIRFGREECVKEKKINKVFWSRILIMIPCFLFGFLMVLVFREQIINYLELPPWIIWLIIGYFLIYSLSEFLYSIFQATNRLKTLALIEVSEYSVLVLGLIFSKIFISSTSFILVLVIGLYLLSKFLINFIFLFKLDFKIFFPVEIEKNVISRILTFSFPLIFSSVAAYVINWVDIAVIKKYLEISQVGFYSLAYKMGTFLQQFGVVLNIVFLPMIIGFLSRKRNDLIILYIKRLAPQIIFFWGIILFFIFILAQLLIPVIFGESFRNSIMPFLILVIGYYFNILSFLYNSILTTFELIKQMVVINIFAMLFNLGLDFLLVPQIGISGAAVATSIVFIFTGVGYFFLANQHLRLKEYKQILILFPILIFFCLNIFFQNIFCLLVGGVILGILMFLIAKYFDLVSQKDKKIFEAVDMPFLLKKGIYKIIDKLSPVL